MSDRETERNGGQIEPDLREMKLEEDNPSDEAGAVVAPTTKGVPQNPTTSSSGTDPLPKSGSSSASRSPIKMESNEATPGADSEREEIVGGDITVKLEPGKAPKLSRTASQKVPAKPARLYLNLPDKTDEATRTFSILEDCTYVPKYMGDTDPALECDCAEEWDSKTGTNHACDEDSDCINRATKMECSMDCGCGAECQNQRFQRKQYAKVSVIKTEKKGYGLRAETDLQPNEFVFEYLGEVINETAFRKRMLQYDDEGIKHFYFMSLSKGEFIDATKKGNLGRFCNHSCNPNCYVDKWVIGDKLRMGIFAERQIKAGEELVFNYNVDRYGANPQPCYCGEPNCTGFIGGKTQTERATKLSNITIEALGIDDGEGWDLAVARRARKKKAGEDDEEYVNNVQPRSLEEGDVTKVMAALRQCKEKWIAVKLLSRIQRSEDERVRHRVVRMHGYQILKMVLATWMEDHNVVLQVLQILDTLPRITRNKIQDSKIEETVEKLTHGDDEGVQTKAKDLLEIWSKLEMGYRIPRVKRDPNAAQAKVERFERRDGPRARSKSRSRSKSPPKGPAAGVPSGPRGFNPAQKFNGPPRPPFRRPPPNPLPQGWFSASSDGRTYYYSASGQTTWQRPTGPASQPPPPPKEKTNEQKLQDIILSITQNATPKDKPSSSSATPISAPEPVKEEKKEKWRSYSEDKQKKIYENTLFPHIKYVVDKYRHKLPKEDLKRFAKEISKKLVNSDFKNGRVTDPTKISEKQEKTVKKYVRDFFEKAVKKKAEHDKKKAVQKAKDKGTLGSPTSTTPKEEPPSYMLKREDADEDMVDSTDDEDKDGMEETSPIGSLLSPQRKRKRNEDLLNGTSPDDDDDDEASSKKFKVETEAPPPPPPPPPPVEDMPLDDADRMDESGLTPTGASADFPGEGAEYGPRGKDPGGYNGLDKRKEKQTDGKPSPPDVYGEASPQQLATPPTTTNGSCDNDHDGVLKEGAHDFEVEKSRSQRPSQLGIRRKR